MNSLILSDKSCKSVLGDNLKTEIIKSLEESKSSFTHYNVDKGSISICKGCFNCWIKTPGECVIDDLGREIGKSYVQSDYLIILTPVLYGCYSPNIKATLDRSIPNILPFFKRIKGEIHHHPRYNKYPNLIVIGYGEDITDNEIITLSSLVNANAVNFQTKNPTVLICKSKNDIADIVKDCIREIENRGGYKNEETLLHNL